MVGIETNVQEVLEDYNMFEGVPEDPGPSFMCRLYRFNKYRSGTLW
jgi:hypothetical protein